MNKLRILLSVLCLFTVTTLCRASEPAYVGHVRLGSSFESALQSIVREFGEPTTKDASQIIYKDKEYGGFTFDEIAFRFRNTKFNEARFTIRATGKYQASRKVAELSQWLSKRYSISKDYDDGAYFYVGGLAPSGIGRLFTIYRRKFDGVWHAVLRYGPF